MMTACGNCFGWNSPQPFSYRLTVAIVPGMKAIPSISSALAGDSST
ncbi:hypothetical protein [Bremerella sp.]